MKNNFFCILFFSIISTVFGQNSTSYSPYPQPGTGYITDIANLLSDDEEERIEQWLWKVEEKKGVEIAVVVINSMSDYKGTPQNIKEFATGLFNKYGIGNMPKNDGVLLLISKNDRELRIELGKFYGHVRDTDTKAIVDDIIVPYFKKDQYATGITEGVKEIILEFASLRVGWNWPLIILIISIPVFILICISLFKNGKRGWGWIFVGIILVVLTTVVYMVVQIIVHSPGRSSGWSSGGYGGGFGGGSSGGGGASGSW